MESSEKLNSTPSVLSEQLNMLLSSLTNDQLYSLVPALEDKLYRLPEKGSVYSITGITRTKSIFSVGFMDTTLGIDHEELGVHELSHKMLSDIFTAIAKIS